MLGLIPSHAWGYILSDLTFIDFCKKTVIGSDFLTISSPENI
jgi:hypothetical protein